MDKVRMRSKFWLGDAEGVTNSEVGRVALERKFAFGLLKHATEEIAILATILLGLYRRHATGPEGVCL